MCNPFKTNSVKFAPHQNYIQCSQLTNEIVELAIITCVVIQPQVEVLPFTRVMFHFSRELLCHTLLVSLIKSVSWLSLISPQLYRHYIGLGPAVEEQTSIVPLSLVFGTQGSIFLQRSCRVSSVLNPESSLLISWQSF